MEMKRVLLIVMLALGGCASAPKVEYRVADYPEPPVIQRPELPVLTITKDMPAGEVIQLHRQTIVILEGYAAKLEAALAAYRK